MDQCSHSTGTTEPLAESQATTLSWKEALRYTCRTHATLTASPQMVVETIHNIQTATNSSSSVYHIVDLPRLGDMDETTEGNKIMEGAMYYSPAAQMEREEFVAGIRQRIQQSAIVSNKKEHAATVTSASTLDAVSVVSAYWKRLGQMRANVLHPFWAIFLLLSFLWSHTSYSVTFVIQRLVQFYLQYFLQEGSDYVLPANASPSFLQNGNDVSSEDPEILSVARKYPKRNATSDSLLTSPIRSFKKLPESTTIAWNERFVSVELILDCLEYIRQQLQRRRQLYHSNSDTETIVSVHSIRQWLQPPSITEMLQNLAVADPMTEKENASSSDPLSLERRSVLPMRDNESSMAEFLNKVSDFQLEWLLSILTSHAEAPLVDQESVGLLRRLDRDSPAGSVYMLQLPQDDDDVRLAFYDVQQSISTIQTNLRQWESTLTTIQKDIQLEQQRSPASPSPQLRRLLQRYKLYRQHKEQGEATLLNLLSVQCSLEHTVQVQQPTVAALQQAKSALQSLRQKQRLDDVLDDIQELREEDPMDVLCREENHMDTDEIEQLEEELFQLQDWPSAPVGGFPADPPTSTVNPGSVDGDSPERPTDPLCA